jgi:hypothetical protein
LQFGDFTRHLLLAGDELIDVLPHECETERHCLQEEGAATAIGAAMSGACSTSTGASQPSCSDDFAIITLAASPYDCQPNVAVIPRQNAIKKRKTARGARRLSDSDLFSTRAFFRSCRADISSDGIARRLDENSDCIGIGMELIKHPPVRLVGTQLAILV